MNPINYLLRRFGTTDQKIKAIEYDMQKNQDEVDYVLSSMAVTDDASTREFLEIQATKYSSNIAKDQIEIERLKYE